MEDLLIYRCFERNAILRIRLDYASGKRKYKLSCPAPVILMLLTGRDKK
jgi:hypothetical protein